MMNTLEKTFWRNMKTKHTKSFNSWCPNNFKEEIHNPKKVFLPKAVFKNILDFCGEPLPPNKNYCAGFNCNITKIYYRSERGKICSYNKQLLTKCKICSQKFLDTGYPNCKNCYYFMDNLDVKRKCLDCNVNFLPKFKGAWKCVKCYYKNKEKKPSCCMLDSDSDED